VLINKDADRVNSFNVWNYAEGHDTYYASMLVDLTLPPDEVFPMVYLIAWLWAKYTDDHHYHHHAINRKREIAQKKIYEHVL